MHLTLFTLSYFRLNTNVAEKTSAGWCEWDSLWLEEVDVDGCVKQTQEFDPKTCVHELMRYQTTFLFFFCFISVGAAVTHPSRLCWAHLCYLPRTTLFVPWILIPLGAFQKRNVAPKRPRSPLSRAESRFWDAAECAAAQPVETRALSRAAAIVSGHRGAAVAPPWRAWWVRIWNPELWLWHNTGALHRAWLIAVVPALPGD